MEGDLYIKLSVIYKTFWTKNYILFSDVQKQIGNSFSSYELARSICLSIYLLKIYMAVKLDNTCSVKY